MIERIRDQVKAGKPLSAALEEEGGTFSPLYLSMVRAGEPAGRWKAPCASSATTWAQPVAARRGDQCADLSGVPGGGCTGFLALLLAYVVPQFVPIFQDLGVPIPLITQVILGLGEFLGAYGLVVLAGLSISGWVLAARLRDPAP